MSGSKRAATGAAALAVAMVHASTVLVVTSVAGAAETAGAAEIAGAVETAPPSDNLALWRVYESSFANAKYIDLTHAFAPGQPAGIGLAPLTVGAARSTVTIPGLIRKGDAFSYEGQGVGITAYQLPSDQVGTQLDPPAHWSATGATISELPPTFAVRPLVVINIADKVAADPGYNAGLPDIAAWEKRHGRIPRGAVVMIRSDWYRKWNDPKRFTLAPFPGVTLEALQLLHLERGILFHGHEPLDTDSAGDFKSESWLMHHNFTQAEGVMNLDQVPEAGALILIGYAKPEGGTGGFARYIAVAPASWPGGTTIADAPGAPLPAYPAPLKRGADGVLRRATAPGSR
ncbi:MAG: cyclase family protein [Gammaproteobacteria bacterium]